MDNIGSFLGESLYNLTEFKICNKPAEKKGVVKYV
jgi:hypothetical protein